MNRIKKTGQTVWADYLFDCDRSRVDEALAILGGLVAALLTLAVGLWLLSWLTSFAGCGTSFLGLPFLIVARTAWANRTR